MASEELESDSRMDAVVEGRKFWEDCVMHCCSGSELTI